MFERKTGRKIGRIYTCVEIKKPASAGWEFTIVQLVSIHIVKNTTPHICDVSVDIRWAQT